MAFFELSSETQQNKNGVGDRSANDVEAATQMSRLNTSASELSTDTKEDVQQEKKLQRKMTLTGITQEDVGILGIVAAANVAAKRREMKQKARQKMQAKVEDVGSREVTSKESTAAVCVHCGSTFADDVAFCRNCGKKRKEEEKKASNESAKIGSSLSLATTDGDGDVARRRELMRKKTLAMARNFDSINASEKYTREDRIELVGILEQHGEGSLLRGWRSEIDPTGNLDVDLISFCQNASRLEYVGDAHLLFSISRDNLNSLKVEEVTPRRGNFIRRFQQWMHKTFNDATVSPHARFFDALDTAKLESVELDVFISRCIELGYEAGGAFACKEDAEEELTEIYNCCDFNCIGALEKDDLIYLLLDRKVKEKELFKSKVGEVWEWKRQMAAEYMERAKSNGDRPTLPPSHRLAPRAWQASTFETLPTVMVQRRYERNREMIIKARKALKEFMQHVYTHCGNEVRILRLPDGLDPDSTFKFNLTSLRRYFRKQSNTDLDVHALWRALDQDQDGFVGLEDLSPTRARVLAHFWTWAQKRSGSCVQLWDSPGMINCRNQGKQGGWFSDKKMLAKAFKKAVKELGWLEAMNAESCTLLCTSLDYYDCGLIMRSDMEWLDKWRPPEYLVAQADKKASEQLKAHLVKVFGHLLRAWRVAFDLDDSNCVSWKEFGIGCKKAKFVGNTAGIWAYLDADASGMISMKEYDPQSYELLSSFKDWCDINFGSAKLCFKALDEDGNGSVTLREMKRVCKRLEWIGSVETLFDCLDLDGRGKDKYVGCYSLEYTELAFLDSWVGDEEEFLAHDEEDQNTGSTASSPSGGRKSLPGLQRPGSSPDTSNSLTWPRTPSAARGKHQRSTCSMPTTCRCGLGSGCSPTGQGHAHIISDTLHEMHKSRTLTPLTQASVSSSSAKGQSFQTAASKLDAVLAKMEWFDSMELSASASSGKKLSASASAPSLRSPYGGGPPSRQGGRQLKGNHRRTKPAVAKVLQRPGTSEQNRAHLQDTASTVGNAELSSSVGDEIQRREPLWAQRREPPRQLSASTVGNAELSSSVGDEIQRTQELPSSNGTVMQAW